MADDNLTAGNTEKPVVVVRTSLGGGGGGSQEGQGGSCEDHSESSVSASTSASASASASNPSTPTRRVPGSSSSNTPNKERRHREGPQNRRSSGGRDKRTTSTSSSAPAVPSTSEGSTAPAVASGSSSGGVGGGQSSKKNKRFQVKKRAPPKEDIEVKPNDVFVNEKSNFLSQLGKCKRIFEKGHQEVYLHGLGKAIPRAINLAFELKKFYHNTVDYTVNTSTIELVDDIIDLENPEQNPITRARKVSSVDIKVYRCIDLP